MEQAIAAGVIVALAALYVGLKYLPAAWRRRLVHFFTRRGASQAKLVRWLDTGNSCGSGCGSCGACAPGPVQPSEDGRKVIRLHERP